MAADGNRLLLRLPLLAVLLLLLLLSISTPAVAAEFGEEVDEDLDGGEAAMPRRSSGGGDGGGDDTRDASAELAGEAALGGLRRRLELDGALAEAVQAGHEAAERLRSQAAELAELRAENAELRAATAIAAAAAAASAKRSAMSPMVAPPEGVDPERDRDLAQLAGLLAHPDGRRPSGESSDASADDDEGAEEEGGAGGPGCFPAGTPLADCAQVRRRFGLALDAEAAALCDSHRLCAACAGRYGIPAPACDRAYVAVAAGLCLKERDPVRCGREADALLAAMRAVHAPADPVAAGIIGCQRPCAARLLSTVRGQ